MKNNTNNKPGAGSGDDKKAAEVAAIIQRIWDKRFEILFIKASRNFIVVFWKNGTDNTYECGICDMRILKGEKQFFFGHRSYIINLSCVLYYCRHHNGLEIGMTETLSAFVAPDCKGKFLKKKKKYKNIVDFGTYMFRIKQAN